MEKYSNVNVIEEDSFEFDDKLEEHHGSKLRTDSKIGTNSNN